jgi:recombination protein RecA
VKVVKNKLAPPFRQAEFDIDYGRGISQVGSVLDVAVQAGVVGRSGSFFAYGEERLGQGRAKAKAYLEERPEMVDVIGEEVRRQQIADPGASRAVKSRTSND